MTSINRTAYPRFHQNTQYRKQELMGNYSLSEKEVIFVKKHTRDTRTQLNFAVQLKVIQNIGYFLDPQDIPGAIVKQVRGSLAIKGPMKAFYQHKSVKSKHRNLIREYLNLTKWTITPSNTIHDAKNKKTKKTSPLRFSLNVAYQASQAMNNPADIINVVLESMLQEKFELPSFSTIDRLVRHIRYMVNSKIFKQITLRLKQNGLLSKFDALLKLPDDCNKTGYNALKQLPKNPTITNFKELLQHHGWLMQIGNMDYFVTGVAKVKLTQFAVQAKSLDVNDIRRSSAHKKYGLMASLLHHSQQEIKDALAITFCKTIFKIHKSSKNELKELQDLHSMNAHNIAEFLLSITTNVKDYKNSPQELGNTIIEQYEKQGGTEKVTEECQKVSAYNSKNHLPLLWKYYQPKRPTLFALIRTLQLQSSTQNDTIVKAIEFLLENAHKKSKYITLETPEKIPTLSFISENWEKLVFDNSEGELKINRRYFELCIFSYIAYELRSGDMFVNGAGSYGDYRNSLMSWDECLPLLKGFCEEVNIPNTSKKFVRELKKRLSQKAALVDSLYPKQTELVIDENGVPTLKQKKSNSNNKSSLLTAEIKKRMPERNLLDILCNTHHYTGWANVFCPLSGAEPKISNPIERYIINAFGNGTGMGPTQTAKHVKADITAKMLSRINNRHVDLTGLDKALVKLVNYSNSFAITKALGDSTRCAVDGTLRQIYESNLFAEPHFRYKNKGGIAYHYVADNYIAIFSTFIPCGVWEAIEIIEGLLKNKSDIQPDKIHADTQGQSVSVFGLAYLFNIELMPRIRNWKDLVFYRPTKKTKYKHIDSLFTDVIDWDLIEMHWQDLMQVVLSIKNGKISSSTLLRKLNNYSRKNRLYQAFRELGRVVRTTYLLDYISDPKLRKTVTNATNKVEAYNGLSDWVFFGSNHIVASNDPDAMEKAIKYNTIVTDSIVLQNLVDISQIIYQLRQEGWVITREDISRLSPYLTEQIKRFGDYIVNLNKIAQIPDYIRDVACF